MFAVSAFLMYFSIVAYSSVSVCMSQSSMNDRDLIVFFLVIDACLSFARNDSLTILITFKHMRIRLRISLSFSPANFHSSVYL